MTQKELARTERTYRTATARAEEARAVRNAAIRQALTQGMTHAQVSMLTGLSRGRIGQIASS